MIFEWFKYLNLILKWLKWFKTAITGLDSFWAIAPDGLRWHYHEFQRIWLLPRTIRRRSGALAIRFDSIRCCVWAKEIVRTGRTLFALWCLTIQNRLSMASNSFEISETVALFVPRKAVVGISIHDMVTSRTNSFNLSFFFSILPISGPLFSTRSKKTALKLLWKLLCNCSESALKTALKLLWKLF